MGNKKENRSPGFNEQLERINAERERRREAGSADIGEILREAWVSLLERQDAKYDGLMGLPESVPEHHQKRFRMVRDILLDCSKVCAFCRRFSMIFISPSISGFFLAFFTKKNPIRSRSSLDSNFHT